jgi:hypothetical protein
MAVDVWNLLAHYEGFLPHGHVGMYRGLLEMMVERGEG